jgi:hypothetical protein
VLAAANGRSSEAIARTTTTTAESEARINFAPHSGERNPVISFVRMSLQRASGLSSDKAAGAIGLKAIQSSFFRRNSRSPQTCQGRNGTGAAGSTASDKVADKGSNLKLLETT